MAPLWKLLLTFDLSDIKQSIFSRPATFITAPAYPQGEHVLNFMGLGCKTTLGFNYLLYDLLILDLFGHSEGKLTCLSWLFFFLNFLHALACWQVLFDLVNNQMKNEGRK